jgi:hypothetical protein
MSPSAQPTPRAAQKRNPIVIYDETAPVACTITSGEIPERIELVERMRDRLVSIDRTEHGLLLHFAPNTDTEADLRRFAVDEKRCCAFWGFAVDAQPADLTLRWDGPPSAGGLLAALHAYFTGDQELTALTGLL